MGYRYVHCYRCSGIIRLPMVFIIDLVVTASRCAFSCSDYRFWRTYWMPLIPVFRCRLDVTVTFVLITDYRCCSGPALFLYDCSIHLEVLPGHYFQVPLLLITLHSLVTYRDGLYPHHCSGWFILRLRPLLLHSCCHYYVVYRYDDYIFYLGISTFAVPLTTNYSVPLHIPYWLLTLENLLRCIIRLQRSICWPFFHCQWWPITTLRYRLPVLFRTGLLENVLGPYHCWIPVHLIPSVQLFRRYLTFD